MFTDAQFALRSFPFSSSYQMKTNILLQTNLFSFIKLTYLFIHSCLIDNV